MGGLQTNLLTTMNWKPEHGYLLPSSGTFWKLHHFLGSVFKSCIFYKYLIYGVHSCFYILIVEFYFIWCISLYYFFLLRMKTDSLNNLPVTLYVFFMYGHFQSFLFLKLTKWQINHPMIFFVFLDQRKCSRPVEDWGVKPLREEQILQKARIRPPSLSSDLHSAFVLAS